MCVCTASERARAEALSGGGRRARRPHAAFGRPQAGNAMRRAPLGLPGAAGVPVGARVVAEAVFLRQRAAAGRATRRRWQHDELRRACGTCVGRWRCHRSPASAAAHKMGRDESRRIEERGAISRVDSAASRLSGAHPARSQLLALGRGRRCAVGLSTHPHLPSQKGKEVFFLTGAPPFPLQLPSYSPTC